MDASKNQQPYLNPDWQHGMQVQYDYNNLMERSFDAESFDKKLAKRVAPITEKEIEAHMPELCRAKSRLDKKLGKPSRMMSWTTLPYHQDKVCGEILKYADTVKAKFENFVVLGIGGSALGPIAVHQALRHLHYNELPADRRGGPKFYVEDNIDPERMNALLDVIDVQKTLFNVITKSGSTSETMAQFLIITEALKKALGEDWGKNIVVTTDKKNGNLIRIAHQYNKNHQSGRIKIFYIPDGVGGRFSELSPVGLLPAAVCSIDIRQMLAGARHMDSLCKNTDLKKNPAYMAGLLMYIAIRKKNKNIQVVMPYADSLKYFADWHAQLWAESLGKKYTIRGREVYAGQTPVKALGVTDQHSQVQLYTEGPFDKVITFIKVGSFRNQCPIPHGFGDIPDVSFLGGHTLNELLGSELAATEYALTKSGKLNQTITLPEVNEFTIGQLMYFFMMQTAVCGELMYIDAFDQPGVEEGKNATYALMGKPGYEDKKRELDSAPSKLDSYIL